MPLLRPDPAHLRGHAPEASLLAETLEGFRYAAAHPGIGPLLAFAGASAILLRGVQEVLPPYVERLFGQGAEGLALLTAAIDAGDDPACIEAELALHGLAYEAAGHGLLLDAWQRLRGRLCLYWAAHHRAHGRRGPRRDAHDDYVRHALGADLAPMRAELSAHMQRGLATVLRFIATEEATA